MTEHEQQTNTPERDFSDIRPYDDHEFREKIAELVNRDGPRTAYFYFSWTFSRSIALLFFMNTALFAVALRYNALYIPSPVTAPAAKPMPESLNDFLGAGQPLYRSIGKEPSGMKCPQGRVVPGPRKFSSERTQRAAYGIASASRRHTGRKPQNPDQRIRHRQFIADTGYEGSGMKCPQGRVVPGPRKFSGSEFAAEVAIWSPMVSPVGVSHPFTSGVQLRSVCERRAASSAMSRRLSADRCSKACSNFSSKRQTKQTLNLFIGTGTAQAHSTFFIFLKIVAKKFFLLLR